MTKEIDEELVSVDALKHVLCTSCGCKVVHIHREQDDPPDFTVIIDGESFPVEVTSIVSLQQYKAHCEEFAKAIQSNAISSGILTGSYCFIVSRRPNIPKPNSQDGRQLLCAAMSYIRATEQAVHPKFDHRKFELVHKKSGKIDIKKVSEVGSLVALTWIRGIWVMDNQVAKLIQQAVDSKRKKLQDKGIKDRGAILLLYDAFGCADHPNDVVLFLQQVAGYDWFHSIFWAAAFQDRENRTFPEEPGREGFFPFSHDPSWNEVGTF